LHFWEKWSSKVLSYLKNSGVQGLEEREDLAQEILYKVFDSLENYNPFYCPSTWIYTISRNHLKSHWRSQKEKPLLLEPETIASKDSVEGDLEEKTERGIIQDYVERQTLEIKQVIYLHFYESLSIRKVAEILQKPYETLRYQIKKIKETAKEELNEYL
jgi:RNA polymerase sigma-70 factor (ECF subfamily)